MLLEASGSIALCALLPSKNSVRADDADLSPERAKALTLEDMEAPKYLTSQDPWLGQWSAQSARAYPELQGRNKVGTNGPSASLSEPNDDEDERGDQRVERCHDLRASSPSLTALPAWRTSRLRPYLTTVVATPRWLVHDGLNNQIRVLFP